MRIRSPGLTRFAALAACVALSACESNTAVGTATVRLQLASAGGADMISTAVQFGFTAPASVSVTILKAELMPGHEEIILTNPGPYDLMVDGAAVDDLLEGVAVLLGDQSVTAGTYEQLRLIVDKATVDGVEVPRLVPSGAETGIKVNFGGAVDLEPGGKVDVTAVISLDQSFVFQGPPDAPKSVSFKPVIHATVAPTAQ